MQTTENDEEQQSVSANGPSNTIIQMQDGGIMIETHTDSSGSINDR